MRWGFLFAVTVVAFAACGGGASPTPTPTSSPAAVLPSPTTEIAVTPETTTPVEPTPEVADEYEGWLTYTNDGYAYEFRYPPEATVSEAEEDEFNRICFDVQYELGSVVITLPPNEDSPYILPCGRTSRAYEGPDREETLVIDGRMYTAQGFEERGPGETLIYHNETLVVFLNDGTRIEYGVGPADEATLETATFEDYLRIRDQLLKIVQSYRRLP
jgi:hypothetical protein